MFARPAGPVLQCTMRMNQGICHVVNLPAVAPGHSGRLWLTCTQTGDSESFSSPRLLSPIVFCSRGVNGHVAAWFSSQVFNWVKTHGTILGQVNSPPILEPYFGWIGMFAGGTAPEASAQCIAPGPWSATIARKSFAKRRRRKAGPIWTGRTGGGWRIYFATRWAQISWLFFGKHFTCCLLWFSGKSLNC